MGLRPSHLRELWQADDAFGQKLTHVVNALASGEFSVSTAPLLGGARLAALKKKDGGVRPMAAGETRSAG